MKVEILWKSFHKNIEILKVKSKNDSLQIYLKKLIDTIYLTNPALLREVDNLVSMYTSLQWRKKYATKNIFNTFCFIINLINNL